MKKFRLILMLFILPVCALAQGAQYTGIAQTARNMIGMGNVYIPIPGASVNVCTGVYTGTACPSGGNVTVYSNQALSTALTQPLTADNWGNFSFWAAPGAYYFTVTGQGAASSSYQLTLPFGISGTNNAVSKSIEQVRYADQFTGVDACDKIHAALLDVSPTGGIVDARAFIGNQSCASNPFAGVTTTKPWSLWLGQTTYQTSVPWVMTPGQTAATFTYAGQRIVGAGVDQTIIQPASGFSGTAVLQFQPAGVNVVARNVYASDMTIDMVHVSGKTAMDLQSISNVMFDRINVINQNGTFVSIENSSHTGALISEGITFLSCNFYAVTPKVAPGIIITDANETSFLSSKLLGLSSSTDSQTGLEIIGDGSSAVGNDGSEGFYAAGSSFASYATLITITGGAGAVQAPSFNRFVANTFEDTAHVAVLNGSDSSHRTQFNTFTANRYLFSVTGGIELENAAFNRYDETSGIGLPGFTSLTSAASDNYIRMQCALANCADLSDAGANTISDLSVSGEKYISGNSGSPHLVIAGTSSGNPQIIWKRAGATIGTLFVTDTNVANEMFLSVGGANYEFRPSGGAFFPQLSVSGALAMNGGGSLAPGQTLTNSGTISGGTVNAAILQQGGASVALASQLPLSGSVAGSTTSLAANTCGDVVTQTVTGATTTMTPVVTVSGALPTSGLVIQSAVTTTNTVSIEYCNVTTAPITPAAATLEIRVIQ